MTLINLLKLFLSSSLEFDGLSYKDVLIEFKSYSAYFILLS